MLANVSFGQYYPTNSVVHRLDPRAKLVFAILYIVMIFFIKSFVCYLFVLLSLFLITSIAKVPIRTLLKSVKAILFLACFTFIINIFFTKGEVLLVSWWKIRIYKEGLMLAIKMAFRLALLVMGSSLLTYTTTPMELTDAIEFWLSPLKLIKFPVHDVAIIMSIALRMIPTLMEETDKIMMAQKARGACLDNGNVFKRAKALIPILIPLFVGAFRRADELSYALDSRCYNATPARTKMKVMRFGFKDIAATTFMLLLTGAIIVDYVLLSGIDNAILFAFFGVTL